MRRPCPSRLRRLLSLVLLGAGSLQAFAAETLLRVDGMVCPNCTGAISEGLGRLPGVERVRADLDNGEITVVAADTVTPAACAAVITELGFTVVSRQALEPGTDAVLQALRPHLKGDLPGAVFTARTVRARDAQGAEILWYRLTFPASQAEAWLELLDEGELPLAVALEGAPDWAKPFETQASVHHAGRLCRDAAAVAILAPNRAALLLRLHP